MRMGDDGAWDGQPGIDVEVAGLAVKAMVGDAKEHARNLRRVTQGPRGSACRAHPVKALAPGLIQRERGRIRRRLALLGTGADNGTRTEADERATTAHHGFHGSENRSP